MKKPLNILFILSDDQGAWAMRCAGNSEIKTPNLDSLAKTALQFENFFCTSPVCSPARASLLTGRIPSYHGVQDWIRGGNLDRSKLGELADLPQFKSETTPIDYLDGITCYTDILAQNGYNCALSGKWHLGNSKKMQHGFSRWFTIGRGGCTYYNSDLVENGEVYIEKRYITDVITDHAIEFIDELSKEAAPFYLSVNYTAPHSPWDKDDHPEEYWNQYSDCEFTATPDLPIHKNQIHSAPFGTGQVRKDLLRGYYAAISAMDANIGRILANLDEIGERENTLVIFSSDNGMNMGHHGIWGKGNGTFPFNMYDTAVKVPLLISLPAQIPQGKLVTGLYSQYDFMPTLLDFLGLPPYTDEQLPGKSFAPTLRGLEQAQNNSVFVYDEYGSTRMIRNGDWKYIHRYPYGPNELYDLKHDSEELCNLIEDEGLNELVVSMRAQLNEWFATFTDPRVDATKEAVTGSGQLCRSGIYADKRDVFFIE